MEEKLLHRLLYEHQTMALFSIGSEPPGSMLAVVGDNTEPLGKLVEFTQQLQYMRSELRAGSPLLPLPEGRKYPHAPMGRFHFLVRSPIIAAENPGPSMADVADRKPGKQPANPGPSSAPKRDLYPQAVGKRARPYDAFWPGECVRPSPSDISPRIDNAWAPRPLPLNLS